MAADPVPDGAKGRGCWGVEVIDIHPVFGSPGRVWHRDDTGRIVVDADRNGPPVDRIEPALTVDVSVRAF